MSDDLKPCPFDGHKALIAQSSENTWYVTCSMCCCEIYGYDDDRQWTKQEVIDYWNRRSTR